MIIIFFSLSLTFSIIPEPVKINISKSKLFVFDVNFNFDTECPILKSAVERYIKIINNTRIKCNEDLKSYSQSVISPKLLNTKVTGICEFIPHENMVESYQLYVDESSIMLTSASVWGILRALESLSQLICRSDDGKLLVPKVEISDYPRFSHRGVLLDTSRHYLPVKVIMEALDGMAYNKLNVFHWHIVDDPSFPYESSTFPYLSQKGAYASRYVYSSSDVKEIVNYAAERGIRVIPEFDMPGHSKSWGLGYPDLLSKCGTNRELINPILDKTYEFLNKLFVELRAAFPDNYFHFGGDEVNFYCWLHDQEIIKYMKDHNITDPVILEALFVEKIEKLLHDQTTVCWEEIFANEVPLRKSSIIQVWRGNGKEMLSKVTSKGYRTIYSAGYYLDWVKNLGWIDRYLIEPTDFNGTPEQKKLVIGAEACLWGEYIDENNLIPRFLTRGSAVAERLWSPIDVRDVNNMKIRLGEFQCRLITRGLSAAPITGPSFCDYY